MELFFKFSIFPTSSISLFHTYKVIKSKQSPSKNMLKQNNPYIKMSVCLLSICSQLLRNGYLNTYYWHQMCYDIINFNFLVPSPLLEIIAINVHASKVFYLYNLKCLNIISLYSLKILSNLLGHCSLACRRIKLRDFILLMLEITLITFN